MQKTPEKNTKYSRNDTILKIGHLPKAIDFPKWSVWVKNSNGQKRAKNDSASTLEFFCAKNRWKKNQIFEKWDHFENRPSCKGYRLCKVVSLGQKLKRPKTCEKRFYKHVRVVLCKKTAGKNTKYSRNETILKIGHLAKAIDFAKWWVLVKNSNGQKRAKNDSTITLELFFAKNRCKKHQIFEKWDYFENRPSCKGYRLCKMVSLGEKFKSPKTCEKRFYKHVRVVLCKKPLKKNQILEKWDHFATRPSWKGYRLCKMVSLVQKFKWLKTCEKRFYKHVRIVLCKKFLEKKPNIREMRPFWKWAILQRL